MLQLPVILFFGGTLHSRSSSGCQVQDALPLYLCALPLLLPTCMLVVTALYLPSRASLLSYSFHVRPIYLASPSRPHNEFLLISFYSDGGGGREQQRRKGHFGIVCSSFAACSHSVSSLTDIGRKSVVKVLVGKQIFLISYIES